MLPIYKTGDDQKGIKANAEELYRKLKEAGIRVHLDDREKKTPGEKFNEWELKGVPMRLELGPKDFQNKEVRCVKRNDGKKMQLSQDGLADSLKDKMTQIHDEMYNKALQSRQQKMKTVDNWADFMSSVQDRCIVMAPWCNCK